MMSLPAMSFGDRFFVSRKDANSMAVSGLCSTKRTWLAHEVGVGGNFYATGSSCRVLEELDFGSVEVMTMKTLSVRGSAR